MHSKMFRPLDGSPGIEILISDETLMMLSNTSFRGVTHKKAGNFRSWPSPKKFLSSGPGMGALFAAIPKLLETPCGATVSLTLTFVFKAGWDQVLAVEDLKPGDLDGAQRYQLGLTASAIFLKKNQILAPFTEFVTIVLTRMADKQFRLDNLYPGESYGELAGDMTACHGLYWLDLDNDGEDA